MSDSGGSVGPGWMHAEGDPPNTHRYWDGSAWQGEPVQAPAAAAPTPPVAQVPAPPAQAAPPSFGPPPAMGAPSPMTGSYGGAPPVQAKKRSVWKLVVGLIVGAMLLMGACTFFVFRLASGPIDVSNEFLSAVQANDFDQAWALSDPSCFGQDDGQAQLEAAFANQTIESYNLQSTNVSNNNGVTRGASSGTVTLSGGDQRRITFVNTKVGDDWRVCGFDISS